MPSAISLTLGLHVFWTGLPRHVRQSGRYRRPRPARKGAGRHSVQLPKGRETHFQSPISRARSECGYPSGPGVAQRRSADGTTCFGRNLPGEEFGAKSVEGGCRDRFPVSRFLSAPANGWRRRQFLTFLGAASVGPFSGRTPPTLSSRARCKRSDSWARPRRQSGARTSPHSAALRELGWIDGRNIAIDYRGRSGTPMRRTPSLQPSLPSARSISSSRSTRLSWPSERNLDDTDRFCRGGRPGPHRIGVKPGPAGGQCYRSVEPADDLGGRRLELLREVVPGLTRVAVLGNVDSRSSRMEMEGVEAAARKLGLEAFRLEVRRRRTSSQYRRAKGAADALYVCSDPSSPRTGSVSTPWRSARSCRP